MAGLVAMKPSLSSRAPVSPNWSLRRCGIYLIRITIACFLSESFVLPIFDGAFRDALFQQCYQTMLCLIYPIFFNLQIITPMLQCSLETCICNRSLVLVLGTWQPQLEEGH
ncbi:unnamed protein product [Malus baccata var. baccata]